MKSGDLRHLITFQRKNFVEDEYSSGTQQSWEDVISVRAVVKGLSGREFLAAGAEQSETTVRVMLRYVPDLSTDMRFMFDGKPYDIKAILPDNKMRQIQILAEVGVKQ